MKRKRFLGVTPAHTALNGRPRSSHGSNLESMEYAGYTAATESNNTQTQHLRKKPRMLQQKSPGTVRRTVTTKQRLAPILIRGPVGEARFTES